jgi:hypothetical protein
MRTTRKLATVPLDRLEGVSGGRWDGWQFSGSGWALAQAERRFSTAPAPEAAQAQKQKPPARGVYVRDLLFR